MGSKEGSKHGDGSFNIIFGIEIPDLLMDLMSCHRLLKNINYVVILKFPKRIWNTIYRNDLLFWNAMIIIWKQFQMM